jgi:hypothetical protein
MLAPGLSGQHGGQAAAQRISEFEEAIRAQAGDVRDHDATAVELGEDLLIEARMLQRQLNTDGCIL